jgi:ketosteroid isomerase-like protein
MSAAELEVLDVNGRFYAAIAARDLEAMEVLWARRAAVACVHPGWDALRGREDVMGSWRSIIEGDPPRISCTRASAHVIGEVAFVVCQERVEGGFLVATNVFLREDGAWRICHHHAGPMATAPEERDAGLAN